MPKYRKYNIVFHNVDQTKCQEILNQYVKNVKEYVMSVEPYPQGDGFHAHMSVEYSNQRSFQAVLKELEKLKAAFIATRPDDCPGQWGRVQLDVMRGTFQQNQNYLLGLTKDKPLGDVTKGKKYPGRLIQRMIAHILHRFYDLNELQEMPDTIEYFDEKYGQGFCDACYYEWYDENGELQD